MHPAQLTRGTAVMIIHLMKEGTHMENRNIKTAVIMRAKIVAVHEIMVLTSRNPQIANVVN